MLHFLIELGAFNLATIFFNVFHGRNSLPVSPVLTSNGYVVLGLANGEVITYHVDDNSNDPTHIKSLNLGSSTKNTPCVSGNSVYLSTDVGLKKVTVQPNGVPTLDWTFNKDNHNNNITLAGGASPLYLNGNVYFDAKSGGTFRIFKVNADNGFGNNIVDLPARLPASIAQFPTDNTMWYFPFGFRLEHIDENGNNPGSVSDVVLGGVPSSAITMASNNVLIVGNGLGPNAAVTAINLNNNSRLWRVGVGQLNTFGQFAIVNQNVFCTTNSQRLYKLS